jgi:hypothetical protein
VLAVEQQTTYVVYLGEFLSRTIAVAFHALADQEILLFPVCPDMRMLQYFALPHGRVVIVARNVIYALRVKNTRVSLLGTVGGRRTWEAQDSRYSMQLQR